MGNAIQSKITEKDESKQRKRHSLLGNFDFIYENDKQALLSAVVECEIFSPNPNSLGALKK